MSRAPARRLSIRSAALGDAVEISRLADALGYPMSGEETAGRLAALLVSADHAVLVADSGDGSLAGWAHVEHRRSLEGGEKAELMGLIVDKDLRRSGVGRSLLEAAQAWATSRSLRSITVRSNVARTSSHPFYEACGFRRLKTQNVYVRTLLAP